VAKPSPPEIATYTARFGLTRRGCDLIVHIRNKSSVCTYGNTDMRATMNDHVDFDGELR